jgi:hypothetical protein
MKRIERETSEKSEKTRQENVSHSLESQVFTISDTQGIKLV